MSVTGLHSVADARLGGREINGSTYRKVTSQAGLASSWMDLSMAGGSPPAQYYASNPLEAASLQAKKGMYHGFTDASETKYLTDLMVIPESGGMVGPVYLLDYLLYYPFIALDDLDTQVMDNTLTLPRYEDGEGVYPLMVVQAPTVAGETFTMTYVDHAGVEQTTLPIRIDGGSIGIASVATGRTGVSSQGSPFLNLANGSRGVRQINSVQFSIGGGGLCAIVLVKPIARMNAWEQRTPTEVQFSVDRVGLPIVHEDAHLQMIVRMNTAAGAGSVFVASPNFVHIENE